MEKNNTIIHNKKYLDYPSFFRIFVSQIKLYAIISRKTIGNKHLK